MFNLADYKTAATKIKEVHEHYPMCRFNIRQIEVDHKEGYVWVITELYRDMADQYPAAVDGAYEFRSDRGVNRDFWVENCITSSYGRVCSLLLGDDQRSSREDMEKVQRLANAPEKPGKPAFADRLAEKITIEVADDPWTIKAIDEAPPVVDAIALVKESLGGKTQEDIPSCSHGEMIWKHGVSSKNKKPWGQFRCKMQAGAGAPGVTFCEPIWYEINADGTWQPQKKWA
jgi:hypothetical protein